MNITSNITSHEQCCFEENEAHLGRITFKMFNLVIKRSKFFFLIY
jgi:hypothetical protein